MELVCVGEYKSAADAASARAQLGNMKSLVMLAVASTLHPMDRRPNGEYCLAVERPDEAKAKKALAE